MKLIGIFMYVSASPKKPNELDCKLCWFKGSDTGSGGPLVTSKWCNISPYNMHIILKAIFQWESKCLKISNFLYGIAQIHKNISVLIIISAGNVNTGPSILVKHSVILCNFINPVDFNISRSTDAYYYTVYRDDFFQLFNWFQVFSSDKDIPKRCKSEQLKKKLLQGGVDDFSYFRWFSVILFNN